MGKETPGVLDLSLLDAINRGLRANLGLYLTREAQGQALGAQYGTRSKLLPNITSRVADAVEQLNLAALGLPTNAGIAPIRGPFGLVDARGFLTQKLFDLEAINRNKAALQNIQVAKHSYQDARDLVTLVVGGSYLQIIAAGARIDAVQAQVNTSQSLYNQAVDLKKAGVVAAIDVLRAQVEFQVQQQRLLVAHNEFEKDKLQLARTIGLPLGQEFKLADTIPYAPAPPITFEQALERAYKNRSDYKAAQAQVRSAELIRKAAGDQRLPTLGVNADYGIIGPNIGNSHGTFTAAAALNIPIFQGGKVRGEVMQADAALREQQAQLDDIRARIEYEIRTAFLDLRSAADQVAVAQSSLQLAQEQLKQAQDRFAAGVTNNIEVIQAQEALATTNENYISSLFAHNLAKLNLSRALGITEEAVREFLGGK
jgi:outer membrane protein TolC